jgi:hypothetical protein
MPLDQSDLDLRYSLANMVAVIVGSPPRSNHLWYHLFAPQELKHTFMIGFLVSIHKFWQMCNVGLGV